MATVVAMQRRDSDIRQLNRSAFRSKIVDVTPEQADKWLKTSKGNRSISKRTVASYAMSMTAGRWVLTPQALLFDTGDHLRDGHHRLMAVVKSKKTVPFLCVYGMTDEMVHHIDQGRSRSVSDSLTFDGGQYTHTTAAVARNVFMLLEDNDVRFNRSMFDATMDLFGEEISFVGGISRVKMPAPAGGAFALALPIAPNKIKELLTSVVERDVEAGSAGSAILRAMGDPLKLYKDRMGVSYRVLRAIQSHVQNTPITVLKTSDTGFLWMKKERIKKGLPVSVFQK